MKTKELILKTTVIGSFILITFYLVHAQKNSSIPCMNTDLPIAYNAATTANTLNLHPAVSEETYLGETDVEMLSDAIFESEGLRFDVNKTKSVSSLSTDCTPVPLDIEDMNEHFYNTDLLFDVSKTNSIQAADKEWEDSLNAECNRVDEESLQLIQFNVNETISYKSMQNEFAK